MVGDPTAEKLHNWLAKDQAKDEIKHAGIVREPTLPTRQAEAFTAAVLAAAEARPEPRHNCWQCGTFEDEPAAEKCGNPHWHLPNVSAPAERAVPGWRRVGADIDRMPADVLHEHFLRFWEAGLRPQA